MKKLFAALAASAFFLTGCGTEANTNLGAQDFQAKTHALNIDVEGSQFDAEIGKLDKEATYAVYCRSGRRSQVAIDRMKNAGFTNLVNLNAGVQEWAAAGLPLVTN